MEQPKMEGTASFSRQVCCPLNLMSTVNPAGDGEHGGLHTEHVTWGRSGLLRGGYSTGALVFGLLLGYSECLS